MRKGILLGAALAAATAAGPAPAQNVGQLVPAPILAPDARLFGGYLTAGDDALGMVAQLRLSFVPNVDFGFQGGLNRVELAGDDRTTVRMGTDVRLGVLRVADRYPVDVSVGAGIGVQTGEDFTVLSLGPGAVASRTFPMAGQNAITPYVGAYLRFSSIDLGATSDTDFDLDIRLGAELSIGPDLGVVGELQLKDDSGGETAFATGLNIRF